MYDAQRTCCIIHGDSRRIPLNIQFNNSLNYNEYKVVKIAATNITDMTEAPISLTPISHIISHDHQYHSH